MVVPGNFDVSISLDKQKLPNGFNFVVVVEIIPVDGVPRVVYESLRKSLGHTRWFDKLTETEFLELEHELLKAAQAPEAKIPLGRYGEFILDERELAEHEYRVVLYIQHRASTSRRVHIVK